MSQPNLPTPEMVFANVTAAMEYHGITPDIDPSEEWWDFKFSDQYKAAAHRILELHGITKPKKLEMSKWETVSPPNRGVSMFLGYDDVHITLEVIDERNSGQLQFARRHISNRYTPRPSHTSSAYEDELSRLSEVMAVEDFEQAVGLNVPNDNEVTAFNDIAIELARD